MKPRTLTTAMGITGDQIPVPVVMHKSHGETVADLDGIRFIRGLFFGTVFSLPIWAMIFWTVL